MIKAIVISLPGENPRKTFQKEQLKRLNLDADFLEAATPENLPNGVLDRYASSWARPLRATEIALTHSHLLAWQAVVERNAPSLILEDDAVLCASTSRILQALSQRSDLEFVNLETFKVKKLIAKEALPLDVGDYGLARLFRDGGGSAAYVVWPEAALKLIQSVKFSYPPSDAALNLAPGIIRHQLTPAAAIQAMFVTESDPFHTPSISSIGPTTVSNNARPPYRSKRQWVRCKLRRLAISVTILKSRLKAVGMHKPQIISYTHD